VRENYPNLKLLLAVINDDRLRSNDPEKVSKGLLEIFSKITFSYSENDPGFTDHVVLRHYPGFKVFFTNFEEVEKNRLDKKIGEMFPIMPVNKEYRNACKALSRSIRTYRSFLTKCTKGDLDSEQLSRFANECFLDNLYKVEFFSFPKKPFDPIVWMTPNLVSLEDVLEMFGILYYFFNGKGKIFSWIKQCKQCGKFFLPTNPKAFFCSERCRGRLRYLKKIGKK